MRFIATIFSFLLTFCLTSCGQSADEKRAEAIDKAILLLSSRECEEAVSVLESAGRDNENATYLKTLAAAYACQGGFDVVSFFENDISLLTTPAPMGGFSRISTSQMDSPQNDGYNKIQIAIDLLLYAGGIPATTDPSPAQRVSALGNESDAAEVNSLLMYLLIIQLGNYIKYYGNTSSAGVKGAGDDSNTKCFLNYDGTLTLDTGDTLDDYFTALGVAGNTCDASNDGHSQLGNETDGYQIDRLCEGVVLMNNFFLIFPSVIAGVGGSDFTDIATLEAPITTAKGQLTTLLDGGGASVYNVLSQAKCENLNQISQDFLQVYFAVMYEVLVL